MDVGHRMPINDQIGIDGENSNSQPLYRVTVLENGSCCTTVFCSVCLRKFQKGKDQQAISCFSMPRVRSISVRESVTPQLRSRLMGHLCVHMTHSIDRVGSFSTTVRVCPGRKSTSLVSSQNENGVISWTLRSWRREVGRLK
jgi:hypothetical protein